VAAENRNVYLYRRERADGSANETIALRNFEKWLTEAKAGDVFFVARCRWVECEQDGTATSGGHEFPHVKWVREADAVEN